MEKSILKTVGKRNLNENLIVGLNIMNIRIIFIIDGEM